MRLIEITIYYFRLVYILWCPKTLKIKAMHFHMMYNDIFFNSNIHDIFENMGTVAGLIFGDGKDGTMIQDCKFWWRDVC